MRISAWCCHRSIALSVVYTRVRVRDEKTTLLAAGEIFGPLFVVFPLALPTEGIPAFAAYPWHAWVALGIASVYAPIVANWLLIYGANKYSASLGGFASIATPLFTDAIGVMFLGEVITVPIVIGTGLLLTGIWSLNNF